MPLTAATGREVCSANLEIYTGKHFHVLIRLDQSLDADGRFCAGPSLRLAQATASVIAHRTVDRGGQPLAGHRGLGSLTLLGTGHVAANEETLREQERH